MICIIICKCYRHFYNICATTNTFSEPMSSNPLDDVRHVYECMQFSNHYSLFFQLEARPGKWMFMTGVMLWVSLLCVMIVKILRQGDIIISVVVYKMWNLSVFWICSKWQIWLKWCYFKLKNVGNKLWVCVGREIGNTGDHYPTTYLKCLFFRCSLF